MAHLSKLFTKQPVDIPNRSGHDLSFENLLTLTPGTLVPVLCEEAIPNETYDIGHVSQVKLPPMVTDFFGRIDLRFEAFFVPMRILWGGWQNFWTMPENNPYGNPVVRPTNCPSAVSVPITRGSLADYLGIKAVTSTEGSLQIPNVLPFIAYHRIWDEWYRNSKIQKPAFVNTASTQASATVPQPFSLPWITSTVNIQFGNSDVELADGVSMFSLRQRNWAKDYFTTAALYPQASGDVVGSSVEVSSDNSVSIPALRAANVLQRWLDRNNIAGERYSDQIKAQYGTRPSDAVLDRPVFLGSDTVGIYNKTVFGTTPAGNASTKNPYEGVGARGADSSGFKDGQLVDSFKTTEHGYIMILASIVPHAYYSTGVRRYLYHTKAGDFAIPLLQGIGEQAIYGGELFQFGNSPGTGFDRSLFGYQQQYSEYKYHDDEVHGEFVSGSSLESFVLQRDFGVVPTLGTDFLEIGTDCLDLVVQVTSRSAPVLAQLDCYFSLKKISPLSDWVLPTLGDLRNTHREYIPYRGTQL